MAVWPPEELIYSGRCTYIYTYTVHYAFILFISDFSFGIDLVHDFEPSIHLTVIYVIILFS